MYRSVRYLSLSIKPEPRSKTFSTKLSFWLFFESDSYRDCLNITLQRHSKTSSIIKVPIFVMSDSTKTNDDNASAGDDGTPKFEKADDESFVDAIPPKDRKLLDLELQSFVVRHSSQHRPIALVSSGGTAADLEVNSVRCLDNFSTGKRGSISVEGENWYISHFASFCVKVFELNSNCFFNKLHIDPLFLIIFFVFPPKNF